MCGGGGVQPVHLSSITTIIGAYESMRGGFSRYICQVSPLSSGPMKVEGGGGVFSRYLSQVSPASSGPMRGDSAGTSVNCCNYHQAYERGVQAVHLSRRGFQPVHLSSVATIIRAYERRGSVGTSIKCHQYHQGL